MDSFLRVEAMRERSFFLFFIASRWHRCIYLPIAFAYVLEGVRKQSSPLTLIGQDPSHGWYNIHRDSSRTRLFPVGSLAPSPESSSTFSPGQRSPANAYLPGSRLAVYESAAGRSEEHTSELQSPD